ncbi:MAG: DUF2460 domain-containing protein [Rickettsiales bacterium]|nr:MAG: DUF2460 domain-containing protein [Rickettsiales bacterium]
MIMKFPENIAFNSTSIIEFSTNITQSKNGSEVRNINWDTPRLKFNVKNSIKTISELQELMLFFRKVQGRANAFKFKDWSDYKAIGEQIGIGDGTNTDFYLIKKYGDFVRKIKQPTALKIYINDIENSDYQIENGIIVFETAPEQDAIITADFEFDVLVRFDNDELEISMCDLKSGNIKDIMLVEVIE